MPNVPPSSIAIVSFSRSSSNALYGGKSRRLKHVCDLDTVRTGGGGGEAVSGQGRGGGKWTGGGGGGEWTGGGSGEWTGGEAVSGQGGRR